MFCPKISLHCESNVICNVICNGIWNGIWNGICNGICNGIYNAILECFCQHCDIIMQAMQCTSSGELQYFGVVKCTKTTSVCLLPFLPLSRQQFVAKVWTLFPAQIL